MSTRIDTALVSALALLALPARDATAQVLWGINGAAPTAMRFTMDGGGGACGFPTPSIVGVPLNVPAHPCPTPAPFAIGPGIVGDVAYDKVRGVLYATDGITLSAYSAGGGVLMSIPAALCLPGGGSIKGLGFDSAYNRLFISDGPNLLAITPPAGPCVAVPPAVVWGPYNFAALGGVGALVLDVAYDAISDSLWLADDKNIVTRLGLGGGGPVISFNFPGAALGVPGVLPGIAFDSAANVVIFTDGFTIVRATPGGLLAPAVFYAPFATFPSPAGGKLSGLEFSGHAIGYGTACSTLGPPPQITADGEPYTGNPSFAVRLSGALPLRAGVILLGGAAACPPIPVGPCSLFVAPPFGIYAIATDAVGECSIPVAIPLVLPFGLYPTGLTVDAQFYIPPAGAGTGRQTTRGLSFTICSP